MQKREERRDLDENAIDKEVVDAAIVAHRELSPGLLETVYEVVPLDKLRNRGFGAGHQAPIPIVSWGIPLALMHAETLGPINPTKDTTIYSESIRQSNSNGSGTSFFAGKTADRLSSDRHRALMTFDLSPISTGSDVTSVSLTLQVTRTLSRGQTFSLHRLTNDWGEAGFSGSGRGALAQTSDATWPRRFFNTVS